MSRLKQLGKDSLIYGISSILNRGVTFLLTPFYLQVLSLSAVGELNLIFAFIAISNIIYQLGFDLAYLRCSQEKSAEQQKSLFSVSINTHFIWGGLLSMALYFLGDFWMGIINVSKSQLSIVPFIAGIIWLDTLCVVPFSHLRMKNRALKFAFIRSFNVFVNVLFNWVFLVQMNWGLKGVFAANAIASLFTLLLLLPVFIQNYRWQYSSGQLKELLQFGLPFLPAGLSGIVIEMSGRWALSSLEPSEVQKLYPGQQWNASELVGLFSANWKLGILGLLIVQMFRMAWQPFYLKRFNDLDASKLFGKVFPLFLLSIAAICIPVSLFLKEIMSIPLPGGRILIPKIYWEGMPIIAVAYGVYIFQAIAVFFTLGIYIRKKTRFFIFSNGLAAGLCLAVNFSLVHFLGYWAAPLASFIAYLVVSTLQFWKSQKLFPIEIDLKLTAFLLLYIVIGLYTGFHGSQPDTNISLFIKIALSLIYLFAPMAYWRFSRKTIKL